MPEMRSRPVRSDTAITFTPAKDDPNVYARKRRAGQMSPGGFGRGFRNGLPIKFYSWHDDCPGCPRCGEHRHGGPCDD